MAPPTKAKPSRRSAATATQPGTEPTKGRMRKPIELVGGATMLERLGGTRYEADVIGVFETAGGTVGERVPVGPGRDVCEPLRGIPVLDRDGLTEPVIMCGARPAPAARTSPTASAGKRLRMVCARWVAWKRDAYTTSSSASAISEAD